MATLVRWTSRYDSRILVRAAPELFPAGEPPFPWLNLYTRRHLPMVLQLLDHMARNRLPVEVLCDGPQAREAADAVRAVTRRHPTDPRNTWFFFDALVNGMDRWEPGRGKGAPRQDTRYDVAGL